MQKVLAVSLASLLLLPAGGFAQEFTRYDGVNTEQSKFAAASTETLRDSALRQARLAAVTGAAVQDAQTPSSPNKRRSIKGPVLLGAGLGFLGGALFGCEAKSHEPRDPRFPRESCVSDGYYFWMFGANGALLGAGVGALLGLVLR